MRAKINRRKLLAAGATAAGAALSGMPLGAQQARLHEIEIRGFRFIPDMLEVRPGDTVRWTNLDRAPHDATALHRSWNSAILRQGDSDEIVVQAGMESDYFCSIHPNMRASLSIVES